MNIFKKPEMPQAKPATPIPQEDAEVVRRAKLNEYSRLSKGAGRGAVTLTSQENLGSYGTGEIRQGLGSAPVLTG